MSREALDTVADAVGECRRCALGSTRDKLVFGSGDPDARLMLIGEAPGRSEDRVGRPFVGAAGKLLDELLASIGLDRADVYIANVLKCRPPGNRDPRPEEIEACAPFLQGQVDAVDPAIVVTLGNFATRFMLGTREPIGRLRGRIIEAPGRRVFPVFHPAAVLYSRQKRDVLFDDFERLRVELGILASARRG